MGLEPTTLRLEVESSIQLSYRIIAESVSQFYVVRLSWSLSSFWESKDMKYMKL